jgi:hypothetical protein
MGLRTGNDLGLTWEPRLALYARHRDTGAITTVARQIPAGTAPVAANKAVSGLSARSLSGPGALAGSGRMLCRSNRFARMKSSAIPGSDPHHGKSAGHQAGAASRLGGGLPGQ